jgi:hypothetical protein
VSSEAGDWSPTHQVLDAEGTDRNGVVTRVLSWHECSVSGASRTVRVAFGGFRSECRVRVICKSRLTTVVTSLAPSEEDIELFVTLSAGGFGANEFWRRATEEW